MSQKQDMETVSLHPADVIKKFLQENGAATRLEIREKTGLSSSSLRSGLQYLAATREVRRQLNEINNQILFSV